MLHEQWRFDGWREPRYLKSYRTIGWRAVWRDPIANRDHLRATTCHGDHTLGIARHASRNHRWRHTFHQNFPWRIVMESEPTARHLVEQPWSFDGCVRLLCAPSSPILPWVACVVSN